MIALLTLLACGSPQVSGQVVDVTGAPMQDATVTVVGKLCQTKTDAEGRFELPCQTGDWKVVISQKGYLSQEVDVAATEATTYDVGTAKLVEIPKGDGLFLLRDGVYDELERGVLVRQAEGRDAAAYCAPEAPEHVNTVSAGAIPLFDNDAPDWRVWKLDDEGCAYRMKRLDTRWERTYGERVEASREEVGTEQEVVTLELPAGRYFFAEWEGGFFTERKGEWPDDRTRYGGFHVVAE